MKRFSIFLIIFTIIFSTVCHAENIKICIDDIYLDFDTAPIIQDNRTLVPMRKIFEELGCEVEWLSKTQTVIATRNSKIIALQIGKSKIIVTDIETGITDVTEIDTAPILYNSTTFVPVRVISESLNYMVSWNNDEKIVSITTNQ